MNKRKFYTPTEVESLYEELIPAYQAAFEAPPWNEVSKCIGTNIRCVGGLSSVRVGAECEDCGACPSRPAYEPDELKTRFDTFGASRPTGWYIEQTDIGLTLAALAWKAKAAAVAAEKYADVPDMQMWVERCLSQFVNKKGELDNAGDNSQIMWLDEVFANKQLKRTGNLRNFGGFVLGLARMLECQVVAYRTIEPRMTYVATRDFGTDARIFRREIDVPDRRDFVVINTSGIMSGNTSTSIPTRGRQV